MRSFCKVSVESLVKASTLNKIRSIIKILNVSTQDRTIFQFDLSIIHNGMRIHNFQTTICTTRPVQIKLPSKFYANLYLDKHQSNMSLVMALLTKSSIYINQIRFKIIILEGLLHINNPTKKFHIQIFNIATAPIGSRIK